MDSNRNVFSKAVDTIAQRYGARSLKDPDRVFALLGDLAPYRKRERKLLISAIREGVVDTLITARNESKAQRDAAFNRCVKTMIDERCLTRDAATMVVDAIARAVKAAPLDVPEKERVVAPSEGDDWNSWDRDPVMPDALTARDTTELIRGQAPELLSGDALCRALRHFKTIGYKAFAGRADVVVATIPDTILTIRARAFANCVALRRVELPTTLESFGPGVFDGCDALQEIAIRANRGYAAQDGLFVDKNTKTFLRATLAADRICEVPDRTITIAPRAFDRAAVEEIAIPASLEAFYPDSFYECPELRRFRVARNNPQFDEYDGAIVSKTGDAILRYPTGSLAQEFAIPDDTIRVAPRAFRAARALESVYLPNTLLELGAEAFAECRKLGSVMTPSSLTTLGRGVFKNCKALANVVLSRGLEAIPDQTFFGCVSLTAVSLPKSVLHIGCNAFGRCSNLKQINIPGPVEEIDPHAFDGAAPNLEIVVKQNERVARFCKDRGIACRSV